jgi:hypothetical protein
MCLVTVEQAVNSVNHKFDYILLLKLLAKDKKFIKISVGCPQQFLS